MEVFEISVRINWRFMVILLAGLTAGWQPVCHAATQGGLPYQTVFDANFPTIDQLKFQTLSQGEVRGENLLGRAVVILCFEPGCAGCIKKLPALEKIRAKYDSDGIAIVALSSSGESLSETANNNRYEWLWVRNATAIRPKIQAHRAFEVYLFDRTGKVSHRFPSEDHDWMLHLEIALAASFEKAPDFSDVEQAFVGSNICGMCHTNEFADWRATAHAKSIQTLAASRSEERADCKSCHVTGEQGPRKHPWNKTPAELREVGCEECHGPGGPHRSKPYTQANLYSSREESCLRCHDAFKAGCSKSWKEPKWDYATGFKAAVHRKTPDAPAAGVVSPGAAQAPR